MEGSRPAVPAEPGTLKASLIAMPGSHQHFLLLTTVVPGVHREEREGVFIHHNRQNGNPKHDIQRQRILLKPLFLDMKPTPYF